MDVVIKSEDGRYLRVVDNQAVKYEWVYKLNDATVFSLDIKLHTGTSHVVVDLTPPLPFEPVNEFNLAYFKKWDPRFVPVVNDGYRELGT